MGNRSPSRWDNTWTVREILRKDKPRSDLQIMAGIVVRTQTRSGADRQPVIRIGGYSKDWPIEYIGLDPSCLPPIDRASSRVYRLALGVRSVGRRNGGSAFMGYNPQRDPNATQAVIRLHVGDPISVLDGRVVVDSRATVTCSKPSEDVAGTVMSEHLITMEGDSAIEFGAPDSRFVLMLSPDGRHLAWFPVVTDAVGV